MARKNTYRRGRKRLVLTKHLLEKWAERYGAEPSEAEIHRILECGALACQSMRMAYPDGRRWNSPGVYIDFEKGICLLTDETPHNSVRVFTFLDGEDMDRGACDVSRDTRVLRVVGIGNRDPASPIRQAQGYAGARGRAHAGDQVL